MAKTSISSPYHRCILRAIHAVHNGTAYLAAADKYHIPATTIHYHKRRFSQSSSPPLRPGRHPALIAQEENLVVELLMHYSKRGIPLRGGHLKEAIEIIVSRMPEARKVALPFRNGSPGLKYMRNFLKRHYDKLRFARALRQEALRFRACNAETLTKHFATFEKLILENDIDAERMWNLEESGATPGRDTNGKQNGRVFMTRGGAKDAKIGQFLNTNRVTMMPAVSAAGRSACPLFCLKE